MSLARRAIAFISAGKGGSGLARYNGIGGTGGFIYIRPMENLSFDYFSFPTKVIGEHGGSATKAKLVGRNARDTVLNVPLGLVCVDEEGTIRAQCTTLNRKYLLAKGGRGGCAETSFKGLPGEKFRVKFQKQEEW
uniref:Obg domain-containing protein n=1 Tax=Ditylenchus dipsaci TaxID=166011 RepID=A0A915EQU7_9BILA